MISINLYDIVLQIINFAAFLYILKYIFFRPIINIIDQRENSINQSLKDINYQQSEAKRLIKDGQQALTDARRDALSIVSRAKESALKDSEKIVLDARNHAERITSQVETEIIAEMEKSRKKLSEEVLYLTTILTEQILGKKIDKRSNDNYITKLLSKL